MADEFPCPLGHILDRQAQPPFVENAGSYDPQGAIRCDYASLFSVAPEPCGSGVQSLDRDPALPQIRTFGQLRKTNWLKRIAHRSHTASFGRTQQRLPDLRENMSVLVRVQVRDSNSRRL